MDIAASDDSKKRKLPLWMLGVSAADNVSKSLDVDIPDIFSKKDVGVSSLSCQTKRKRKTASCEKEVCLPIEEALEVEEPSVLVKCRMRRRKGRVNRQDDSSDNDTKEVLHGKKRRCGVGRNIGEPIPLKRRRANSFGYENDDDIEISSPGDNNEDDLTMEDIMSFAKEYVQDDNGKGQQQQSGGALSTISHFADAALSRSENEVTAPSEYGLGVEESSVIVKCGMKGRKKEVRRPDASCDANAKDIGCAKKKPGRVRNKVDIPVPSKGKTKSSGFKSNDDIDVWSFRDDDEDLTMEDLMSIAKEASDNVHKNEQEDHMSFFIFEQFVEDDNVEHQKELDGVLRAENWPVDAAFYRSETGDSTIDPQILRRIPTHEEAVSRHSLTNSMTSTTIIDKPIMTGDPTQDMLDLFLGPLLKKPAKRTSVVSGDITFFHEEKKQNENLVIGNAPAPLTKKKSSLKEKVAMFLD